MLGIVGTVPDLNFPLLHGPVCLNGDHLELKGRKISVNRGTPALLAAAATAAQWFKKPNIYAFLVGDIGKGEGSRKLYEFLTRHLSDFEFNVLTFHYLQPDVDWHNKVLFAAEAMPKRPILIADAGFMYAAKMSGEAGRYDFFTPDAGELAFLADEIAPHPFYTRGFILHRNNAVPELIARAYRHQNAATHLVVKGEIDYIATAAGIAATVEEPAFDAMEAIGGTGDLLTGLLSVLCAAGIEPARAALLAAKINRRTGRYHPPNPATQVAELIRQIPKALSAMDMA